MRAQSQQPDNLRASVIDRFSRIAVTPNQDRKFPVGLESAKKLGHERAEVETLPSAITESFCGVGNPFSLGGPESGETVLDLGCAFRSEAGPRWCRSPGNGGSRRGHSMKLSVRSRGHFKSCVVP